MEENILASILIKKNNDFFRKNNNIDNCGYIFDSQINTGRKIVMQLASSNTRRNHVNLIAPMQGGKTGACNSVINIIEKSKLYKYMSIKKYMFITGMNDCGLKDQTYIRLKEQVIGANEDNIYLGKRSKRNFSDSKFFVLKNSDLMSFEDSLDNTLIFIDESHYGSNEKNILTKFLEKNEIDWKNTNDLIKRNIYIVSVSATPFDELVSDISQCKKIIELKTDDNYVSVSDLLNNNLIFNAESDDISYDGKIFEYIMDAQYRMDDNDEDGVIIIRTRDFDTILENPYITTNFNIFKMDSNGSRIEYHRLNEMMEDLYKTNESYKRQRRISKTMGLNVNNNTKPLLVLIKGAFRAGITIEPKYKDMIYMIYDRSLKVDTTAQAMLGRMCGYRSNKDKISNTHFYININHASMYSAWENDFNNRSLIPCDKSEYVWVGDDYNGDDVIFGSRSCGNFAIDLTNEQILNIINKCKNKRNKINIIKDDIKNLLSKEHNIEYDYICEAYLSGKNNYAKSSQTKRFDNFTEDSLVCQFRPEKIKEFINDTNRDFLSKEDVGKKCISIVLDATITDNGGSYIIGGNKRMLFYYVEVGQKKLMFNRKKQFKPHKNTKIN